MRERCHGTKLRWRGSLLRESEWEKGGREWGDRLLRVGEVEEEERQREKERDGRQAGSF